MSDAVAPDGSPIEVYRYLPPGDDFDRVHAVVAPGASVLELGCGVGRLTLPLLAAGHSVIAVDESPAMLAEVQGAETVPGDIWQLQLRRRFDAVLAMSNLINDPQPLRRRQLLEVCRRHVADDGAVVVQRYAVEAIGDTTSTLGDLTTRWHDVANRPGGFTAAVTYTLGGRSWTQRFSAAIVDDDEFLALATVGHLVLDGWLDPARRWARLRPV